MGAFYGGIAHVPLSALVLVCEMAGNYDLLVPLMLALGISYVALRKRTLYEAQVATQRDSPAYRDALVRDVLREIRVPRDHDRGRARRDLRARHQHARDVAPDARARRPSTWSRCWGPTASISGVVTAGQRCACCPRRRRDAGWAIASDVMQPAVTVRPEDDLRTAAERMVHNRLRVLLVVDGEGRIVGVLDESEIAKVYLRAAARADDNTQEIVLKDVGAEVQVEQPVGDTTEKQPADAGAKAEKK